MLQVTKAKQEPHWRNCYSWRYSEKIFILVLSQKCSNLMLLERNHINPSVINNSVDRTRDNREAWFNQTVKSVFSLLRKEESLPETNYLLSSEPCKSQATTPRKGCDTLSNFNIFCKRSTPPTQLSHLSESIAVNSLEQCKLK